MSKQTENFVGGGLLLRETKIDSYDKGREDLCALLDGEASEVEVQRILNAMDGKSGKEVRELWRRYNLVSDSVRNKTFDIGLDVSGDVIAAITNQAPRILAKSSTWSEVIVQLGVAASVAMLTLFSVQYYNDNVRFDQTLRNVEVEPHNEELNSGPAAQFPSGFKPNINVRTVSAGSIRESELKVTLDSQLFQDDRIREHIDRKVSEYYRQSFNIGRHGKQPFVKLKKMEVTPD